MSHFENCADVHCHPTASIGEAEGYSPHSPEDFLSLAEQIHRGKPLYIKFVVTGNHLFAVVYRRGLSTFDATRSTWRKVTSRKRSRATSRSTARTAPKSGWRCSPPRENRRSWTIST